MKTRLGTLLRLEEKWLLAGIGVWISTYLIVRYFCIEPGDAGLRWDAAWYAEAASRGYTFNGNPNYMQVVGFMPLFPSVIALLSKSGLSINLLMSVVPIICVSLAIPLLFRAIETLTSSARSTGNCACFSSASPFSLFFLNGSRESLYLLLIGLFFFSLVLYTPICSQRFSLAAHQHRAVHDGIFQCFSFSGACLQKLPGDHAHSSNPSAAHFNTSVYFSQIFLVRPLLLLFIRRSFSLWKLDRGRGTTLASVRPRSLIGSFAELRSMAFRYGALAFALQLSGQKFKASIFHVGPASSHPTHEEVRVSCSLSIGYLLVSV